MKKCKECNEIQNDIHTECKKCGTIFDVELERGNEGSVETKTVELTSSDESFCEECGKPVAGSEKFCISCGNELDDKNEISFECGKCKNINLQGTKFCVQCGASLIQDTLPVTKKRIKDYLEMISPKKIGNGKFIVLLIAVFLLVNNIILPRFTNSWETYAFYYNGHIVYNETTYDEQVFDHKFIEATDEFWFINDDYDLVKIDEKGRHEMKENVDYFQINKDGSYVTYISDDMIYVMEAKNGNILYSHIHDFVYEADVNYVVTSFNGKFVAHFNEDYLIVRDILGKKNIHEFNMYDELTIPLNISDQGDLIYSIREINDSYYLYYKNDQVKKLSRSELPTRDSGMCVFNNSGNELMMITREKIIIQVDSGVVKSVTDIEDYSVFSSFLYKNSFTYVNGWGRGNMMTFFANESNLDNFMLELWKSSEGSLIYSPKLGEALDFEIDNVNILDDKFMFYDENNDVYTVDPSGKTKVILEGQPELTYVMNKSFKGNLIIRPKSSEEMYLLKNDRRIVIGKNVYRLLVLDKAVYFTSEGELWQFNGESSEQIEIDFEAGGLFETDYGYYVTGEDGELYFTRNFKSFKLTTKN